jgi:hypothetical protein
MRYIGVNKTQTFSESFMITLLICATIDEMIMLSPIHDY